ncbi:UvrD-helicase domain-containing protein [Vibrio cyclitrophicus]
MANYGKKIPGLKRLRERANLSQKALSELIKVSDRTIIDWESGKSGCTPKSILSLCRALSVNERELVATGSPEVYEPVIELPLNKVAAALTQQQSEAVYFGPENLVALAGAGSGKTKVVTSRALNLIDKYDIQPGELVIITFTEKAALEIKERLSSEYSSRNKSLKGFDDIFVGTIHQYCNNLIRSGLAKYLSYDLLDGADQFVFIQRHYNELLTDMSYEDQRASGVPLGLKKVTDGKLASYASSLNMLVPLLGALREGEVDQNLVSDESKLVLKRYRKLLEDKRYLDFSSLLEIVTLNLKTNESFKKMVASNLKYLIVDEYQDTNASLEKVISELVFVSGAKLTVVGDDDQSIYGWNNAQVKNLIDFESRYPNVKRIIFPDNFRSTEGIIDTAYRIVGRNTDRITKSITASSHNHFEDGDILSLRFDSPREEADSIAERINWFLGYPYVDKQANAPRGLSYSDMAVLVRTRAQAQHVIARFEELGVPYEFKGSNGIVSGSPLGKALACIYYYLSCKNVKVETDSEDKRTITRTELFSAWKATCLNLTDTVLHKAIEALDGFKLSKMSLNSHSMWAPQNALHVFLSAIKLREEDIPNLSDKSIMSTGEQAFLTIGQFSSMIAKFERHHVGRTKAIGVYRDLASYLEFSADSSFVEENSLSNSRDVVSVLTIHAAKGLEWPMVFMPGMNRNRFPIKRRGGLNLFHFIDEAAFSSPDNYKSPLDEERRLAFVAITRSKKFLFMSSCNEGKRMYKEPSDFFEEARQSMDNYVMQRFSEDYYNKERLTPKPNIESDMASIPFSAIFDHRDCPFSHKLNWVYGFSPVYNEKIGFGNILHNVINDYHQQRISGKKWAVEELEGLVSKHFHLPFSPPPMMKEKLEKSLINRLKNHHEEYGAMSGIKYIEREVTYYSGNVRLEGRLDMLRMYRGGREEIIDYKSSDGGVHYDERGPIFQGLSYALGHEINTGKAPDVVKAITLVADGPAKVKQENVDANVLAQTRVELDKYITEIQGNIAPKRPCNPEKCSKCAVRSMCH